ncbi:MAG: adenine deaminase, partial [Bacteroidales bacterium]|nr:adenine deaminase [Bacteroidales bacterium]
MVIFGNIIDIYKNEIYPGAIKFNDGIISDIERHEKSYEVYILPGLIDSHIHIESSMSTPGSFAATAVRHGTTGVVSDPHEIANVLGLQGIEYMLSDSEKVPLKFWFGAPSCVPATVFESNGAVIDSKDIQQILRRKEIKYLSEVMNYPGVIFKDPEVMDKIETARKRGKKIDGHAPGLRGDGLRKYINTGISTDHECSTIEEAEEKISLDMKIQIREGSAARNLDALKSLIKSHPDKIMLCSDDLHPENLIVGHINALVTKLVNEGFDIFDVIRACTLNPAIHYELEAGLLKPGTPADFIIVESYKSMKVKETWIDGRKVFENGRVLFDYHGGDYQNRFNSGLITADSIRVERTGHKIRVIKAVDGEIVTGEIYFDTGSGKFVDTQISDDILKIVVKDRYKNNPPATAFINGFGLKKGAFASSVAHDSHNVICVGTNDDDIVAAINKIIEMKGGLAVAEGN